MKNDQINTIIESLSHDGKGITRINGKTTFIRNALPGEEVVFKHTQKHSKYDEGEAIEILKKSSDRVIPECEHYDVCGGCSLQHLNHKKQLIFKAKTVLEQLKHIGNLDIDLSCSFLNDLDPKDKPADDKCKTENNDVNIVNENYKIVTGPTYGYRSKARLSAKYVHKKQKMLVGFHEKNGRFVAETKKCPVLHPSVGEKISELADLIASLSIYQSIPQIEVACGDNTTALVLRNLKSLAFSDLEKLEKFGKENHIHFYSQSGGPDTVKPLFTTEKLSYELPDHSIKIYFEPTDFTQINRDINRNLVNHVIELLEPQSNEIILDLFCGIGNFTLPIAKKCKQIIGVEGAKTSIERAIQNSNLNKIENSEFYCYDLTKDLTAQSWSKQKFDKVLLDPPRTGALEICEQIKKFEPKKIVYVSCNPATLARDAKKLAELGYKLKTITILDMYPHTSHIEVTASFVQY